MNNQAAQTMPELPEPRMRELNPYHGSGIDPYDGATHLQWYNAAQMHQYAREYAAALSQTAGVAEPTLEMLNAGWRELERQGVDPESVEMRAVYTAILAAAPAASGGDGPTLHPATEDLIRRFSDALREKLSAAEKKYGYCDGWASPDWMDQCRRHLDQHVAKGDPRDVAAYCAFLWHHGEPTTKRDRDADRKRFPDDDFNAWLDAGISDAGHTVYDSLSSIEDAWQGWHGHVLSVMIDENPVFDDLAIDSLTDGASEDYAKANPLGGPATMFDAIANRLRAGEPMGEVLDDYGLRLVGEAGASVSERARALSDAALIAGWEAKADAYDADDDIDPLCHKSLTLRDCANELRSRADLGYSPEAIALEQALTQQRGEEAVAWRILGKPCSEGTQWIQFTHNSDYAAAMTRRGFYVSPLFTTPQPGAEALRELVQRWRIHGENGALKALGDAGEAVTGAFNDCADELESLLARGGK